MDPHKASCGLHCYDSLPLPARYAEHCHSANGCPLCPPQAKRRTRGRPRTKSEVTQAAILGQLSITELRLIAYLSLYPTDMRHSVACVGTKLKLAARTVGDLFARNAREREYMKQLRRSTQQGLCPGLKIVDGKLPVLKRGKFRTLALREAQTVNWADPRANLYGVYPCPRCGEPDVRASYQRPYGQTIECDSCGDKRPVHRVVQR